MMNHSHDRVYILKVVRMLKVIFTSFQNLFQSQKSLMYKKDLKQTSDLGTHSKIRDCNCYLLCNEMCSHLCLNNGCEARVSES